MWTDVFFDVVDFLELGGQDFGRQHLRGQDFPHESVLCDDEDEVHCAQELQEHEEEETEELLDEQRQGTSSQSQHRTLVTQVVALLDGGHDLTDGAFVEWWLVGGFVDGTFVERWLATFVVAFV